MYDMVTTKGKSKIHSTLVLPFHPLPTIETLKDTKIVKFYFSFLVVTVAFGF